MEENFVYCEACLSVDRQMHPLVPLLSVIHETNLEELLSLKGSICWECKAVMMKFVKLKRRVQQARELLQQRTQDQTLPCLSSISRTVILNMTLSGIDNREKSNTFREPTPLTNKKSANLLPNLLENEIKTADQLPPLPLLSKAIKLEIKDGNETLPVLKEKNNSTDPLFIPSAPIKLEIKEEVETIDISFDNDANINLDDVHTKHEIIPEFLPKFTPVHSEQLEIVYEKPKEHEVKSFYDIQINTPNTSTSDGKRRLAITPLAAEKIKKAISNAQCSKTVDSIEEIDYEALGVAKCYECGCVYADSVRLETHKRRMHRTTYFQFICDICKREFKKKSWLETHMASHSEAIARQLAYCDSCRIQFRTMLNYRSHLNFSVNHSKKRLQCPDCDRCFASQIYLRRHRDFSHLRISKHKCETCNKLFRCAYRLKNHNQIHHGLHRTRNHQCQVCEKSFYTSKTLASHMYTHSSQRPFVCDECGDTFRQAASLYTHKRLKHKKEKRKVAKKKKQSSE